MLSVDVGLKLVLDVVCGLLCCVSMLSGVVMMQVFELCFVYMSFLFCSVLSVLCIVGWLIWNSVVSLCLDGSCDLVVQCFVWILLWIFLVICLQICSGWKLFLSELGCVDIIGWFLFVCGCGFGMGLYYIGVVWVVWQWCVFGQILELKFLQCFIFWVVGVLVSGIDLIYIVLCYGIWQICGGCGMCLLFMFIDVYDVYDDCFFFDFCF